MQLTSLQKFLLASSCLTTGSVVSAQQSQHQQQKSQHFSVLYPGNRGFNDNTKSGFQPCGGISTVTERYPFNPNGMPIDLKTVYPAALTQMKICTKEKCTSNDDFKVDLIGQVLTVGGEGELCLPQVSVDMKALGLKDGDKATIQVMQQYKNEFMYDCIDIKLDSRYQVPSSSFATNKNHGDGDEGEVQERGVCFNSTGVHFASVYDEAANHLAQNTVAVDTTSEPDGLAADIAIANSQDLNKVYDYAAVEEAGPVMDAAASAATYNNKYGEKVISGADLQDFLVPVPEILDNTNNNVNVEDNLRQADVAVAATTETLQEEKDLPTTTDASGSVIVKAGSLSDLVVPVPTILDNFNEEEQVDIPQQVNKEESSSRSSVEDISYFTAEDGTVMVQSGSFTDIFVPIPTILAGNTDNGANLASSTTTSKVSEVTTVFVVATKTFQSNSLVSKSSASSSSVEKTTTRSSFSSVETPVVASSSTPSSSASATDIPLSAPVAVAPAQSEDSNMIANDSSSSSSSLPFSSSSSSIIIPPTQTSCNDSPTITLTPSAGILSIVDGVTIPNDAQSTVGPDGKTSYMFYETACQAIASSPTDSPNGLSSAAAVLPQATGADGDDNLSVPAQVNGAYDNKREGQCIIASTMAALVVFTGAALLM